MKKQAAKDQDKFVVRLPNGMRERIKAKADRAGMSMNDAIVWCLEQFFPEPQTFEGRVYELAQLVAMLKEDGRENQVLEELIETMDDTIREVAAGKVKMPPDFKGEIGERLTQWDEERLDSWRDKHENPFDDDLYPTDQVELRDPGGDLDDET